MAGADGYTADTLGTPDDIGRWRQRSPDFDLEPVIDGELVLPASLSCRDGVAGPQRKVLALGLGGLGLFGLAQPFLLFSALVASLWVLFTALIVWRLILISVGSCLRLRKRFRPYQVDHDLPVYSIMVPVFHEAAMVDQLAKALNQLVWPSDRLDIQILFEADDIETIAAADISTFPPGTRFVIIPPGFVRTKPNALNYGLMRARGEFICIYDAEDRPHPGQLFEAYRTFRTGPETIACAQAPLVADNEHQALIAAHWSLEYATQFGLLVPAMAAMRLPIPIGGTSNHFRRDDLIQIGGWDAWNVTEDADLGLRFARYGRRIVTLNLPTYEDAPDNFEIWAAQRSRWIKGFVQTWLVLMRRPRVLLQQLGMVRFVALQMALGGAVIAPVFHAPVMLLVLAACLTNAFAISSLGAGLLGFGLAVGFLSDVLAPARWHWPRVLAVITRPLYWSLHSFSAARALIELVEAPHFWAKTPHKPHRSCTKEKPCLTGSSA